jgi:secreted trypsin-like serine protease
LQVHIRISSYQCGGVLLNHWYVATAAHCVHQAKLDQIKVHLGEFDTKNTEAVSPQTATRFSVEVWFVESLTAEKY